MLFGMDLSNFFLGLSPQARETKAKISKWDYIKLESLCIAKKAISSKKDSLLNGGRYVSNKELIFKVYKELFSL